MTHNELKNSTIAKLDRNEIGFFKLYDSGVYTYKGTLKSRKAGYKTSKVSDYQTNFYDDEHRIEFIRIQSLGDEEEYAMRVFNIADNNYYKSFPILAGCDFFR